MRNIASAHVRKDKIAREIKIAKDNLTSDRAKWSLVKDKMKGKCDGPPKKLISKNQLVTGPKDTAQTLNRYYIQSIRETRKQIPDEPDNPIDHYLKCFPPISQKMNFEQISHGQMKNVLIQMKSSNSTAKDMISTKTLKAASKSLIPLLQKLVNNSIRQATFPENLKEAKVIPIKKKDKDKLLPSAWRPVNLLPAVGKVIEKVIIKQITKHLIDNKVIPDNHHGATRGKSTITALASIQDKLLELKDKNQEAILIILDQSKAYDLIDHSIILKKKLSVLGFTTNSVNWFKSYLGQRKQFVQIEDKQSDTIEIGPQSVIQGSILSGILYLIFTLDLPKIFHRTKNHSPIEERNCPEASATSFVDDNFIIETRKNKENFTETVNRILDKTKNYMNINKLSQNNSKTQILILTTNQSEKDNFKI